MKNSKQNQASSITRRDFVGGTLIGSGAALLTAKAPGLVSSARADEQWLEACLSANHCGTAERP